VLLAVVEVVSLRTAIAVERKEKEEKMSDLNKFNGASISHV
jgi:hypothetical protein